VLDDLGNDNPLSRILFEHSSQKIFGLIANILRHVEIRFLDLLKKNRNVFVVKRQTPDQESVKDDTTRPDVTEFPFVAVAVDDLWTGIVRRAAGCFEKIGMGIPCRHAKVSNLNVVVAVNEDVLWLEIPMSNGAAVKVVDREHDLLEVVDNLRERERAVLNYIVKELATLDILHVHISSTEVNRTLA
jgi:hypothetical protein